MKKMFCLCWVFVLLKFTVSAGDGDYATWKIPGQLLRNSNAVIRLQEQHIELKSLEKMIQRNHYVITILNEKGARYAGFREYYDKFNSIEFIEGTLYDASGNKIRSLRKKDIQDITASSEMSIMDDVRCKTHNFYHRVYPYTIEYDVEVIQKATMFFPGWTPVTGQLIAVEKSNITIEVPQDYDLRYMVRNYKQEPEITTKDKLKQYSWQIENYEAVNDEVYSPGWGKTTPVVLMAPSEFVIEDYKGKMTDWKEFGLFVLSLNRDRDVLPEAIKQKVHELVKDADSRNEKITRLYKYMQKNTRYVSVQLGLGGWRPFEASYVSSKGYGDCKALTNYMFSLLKEAGIQSYYTLIRGGDHEDDIETGFPCSQFNHVILCVPDSKDTTWLECTSSTVPAGYMGRFTGNRHALMITEEGGKIVTTPYYKMIDNLQERNIKAVLDEEGTLAIETDTRYHGLQQDDIHGMINSLSKDKVKEFLHEGLDFATYDINRFSYIQESSALPCIDEKLDISVRNYATITGKRLFIIPNVMTRSGRKLQQDSIRKYDIQLDIEYQDIDSVEIDLPKGYTTELIPQDVSINSKFGRYACSVKLSGNKLTYYRVIERNSGIYPASSYPELVNFYETIYKSDRNKVVLVKKE